MFARDFADCEKNTGRCRNSRDASGAFPFYGGVFYTCATGNSGAVWACSPGDTLNHARGFGSLLQGVCGGVNAASAC